MSENEGVSFVGRLRKAGAKKTSLIVTIDRNIVDLLKLEPDELVEIKIKRAKIVK